MRTARRGAGALLAAGLAALALFGTGATPAAAQTRAEINEKIEKLEAQLRAVQRRVFDDSPLFEGDGGTERAAPGQGVRRPPAAAGAPNALLADLSLKVDQLERQLRNLTGQIEELQFANRQMAQRLERLEKNFGLRLQALEGGRAGSEGAQANAGQPGGAPPTGPSPSPSAPEEAGAPSAATPPQGTPAEQYDRAYDLLRRGRVGEAEAAFSAFLERHPDHPLAGNAQYWLGETHYVRQDYARAAQAFFAGYQDYGDSSKAPDSLLKLAMTLSALDQTEDACAALDELEERYPGAEDRIVGRMQAERERLGCS